MESSVAAAISSSSKREVRLGSLFLKLAKSLNAGFDLSDYLQHLVEETRALLPADEVGLFLSDVNGELHVAAATTPNAHAVETLVLEAADSPCVDAYFHGIPIGVHDIHDTKTEWNEFARILDAGGFRSVHAVPMRVEDTTIGVVSLFSRFPYTPSDVDAEIAAVLAKAAATAIVQARAMAAHLVLTEQLQQALNSRIIIEQAKGVLAQTLNTGMDDAFHRIRAHARSHQITLQEVSQRVVDRTLSL